MYPECFRIDVQGRVAGLTAYFNSLFGREAKGTASSSKRYRESRGWRQVFVYLSFVFWGCSFTQSAWAEYETKKVLYLNSYNLGYDWNDLVLEGIYGVLNPLADVEIYTELMEGKRFPQIPYEESYLETFRAKYEAISFDAILCSDNYALDWLLAHRNEPLLEGVAVAFCGISNPEDYDGIEDLFGVTEERDFEPLVAVIHEVAPKVKELHVILDNSPTGYQYRAAFEAFRSKWDGRLDFRYHNENSIEDVGQTFGKLGDESAIYYTVLSVGKGGQSLKHADFLPELLRVSKVPVFGDVLASNSEGLLGGPTNNAVIQGRMSAHLILDLLEGRPIEPKVITPDIDWRFDYEVMKRFDLKESHFPERSEIFNRPIPVFEIYKTEIIGTLILVFLLLCTVALLSALLYQKRRYEKEILLEKEKAEESDRLKSAFLANISHEIRTPLNAVIGFSSILEQDETLDETVRSDIEHIMRGGYELRDTVTNILDYSCIESGPVKVSSREVTIGELLSNLWRHDLLSTKSPDQLEVVNQLDEDFSFRVDGDLLVAVLSQLIQNGLKFSHSSIVRLSVFPSNGGIGFCVTDTGIGMGPEELDLVFDPFQKGKWDNTNKYSGAGLGLSIVRFYVSKMGGRVWLESVKGEGTKAYVQLPPSSEVIRGIESARSSPSVTLA